MEVGAPTLLQKGLTIALKPLELVLLCRKYLSFCVFFAEFGGNTFPPRAENILNNILSNISKLVFERLPKSDDEIKTRFDMIFPKRGLTAITR